MYRPHTVILNFLQINDELKCYLRAPIRLCSREYEDVMAMLVSVSTINGNEGC